MKYTTLTNLQLFFMTVLIGLIAGVVSVGASMYREYQVLPVVHMSGADCVKVVNYQNGHAFSCPDVDVLLRQYRSVSTASNNNDTF